MKLLSTWAVKFECIVMKYIIAINIAFKINDKINDKIKCKIKIACSYR